MDKEFKKTMRQKLLEMRSEVISSLIAENNDLRSALEHRGVKDLADVASDDIDVRMLEAVGIRHKDRLISIDAALVRLENGQFGTCLSCGDTLSKARLEAIPYAIMCIKCKENSEKQRIP